MDKKLFKVFTRYLHELSLDHFYLCLENRTLYNSIQLNVAYDQKHPVFLYKFSFEGPMSYSMLYTGTFVNYGVTHCDELIYILKTPAFFPNEFIPASKEMEMRKVLLQYFVDFAING